MPFQIPPAIRKIFKPSARLGFVAALLWLATFLESAMVDFTVRMDFEGGSAHLLEIDQAQRAIRCMPGGSPSRGWVCWWAMKLEGGEPGKVYTLELVPSDQPTRNQGKLTDKPLASQWSMPERAAWSADGRSWSLSEPGIRTPGSIRYEFTPSGDALWMAWGPMFTPKDTQELLVEMVDRIPASRSWELAKTREDRPVLAWTSHVSEDPQPRPGVWIQARQHAWESGSSWVARGFLEWLGRGDESARWLIDNAELVVVPIMDVDNVATGNGGKEADPQDHNRDWTDHPIYPEVQAAQRVLRGWAEQERLDVFIDLHNPSSGDKQPFFFFGPSELLSDLGRENRLLFLSIAQRQIHGPLPVKAVPRSTGPAYHPLWRQISGQWVSDHGNSHTLSGCLETSWNTPHSHTAGYRKVGEQLGETIAEFLQRRRRLP
jgi:hypothetical protein